MKAFVTGGKGLLGNNIVKELLARDHAVKALGTRALFEAWVGEDGRIEKILEPPAKAFYGDVPVPLY